MGQVKITLPNKLKLHYNASIPEEEEMIENQSPVEQVPAASSRKWIWWLVGGGCALLLCAAIAVGAAILFVMPVTTR